MSEQLKVEKELFPQCIQAPLTYTRKKSIKPQLKNKKNKRLHFLGEQISPIKASKMEDYSFNNVDHWLDQIEENKPKRPARPPFADLNVNQSTTQRKATPVKSRADIIMEKVFENTKSTTNKLNRKRSHFKSRSIVASESLLDKFWKPKGVTDSFGWTPKKLKKEFDQCDKENKSEKNESGIVLDDELIIIDDFQSQVVDKDKQAWLAVLDAEKNYPHSSVPSVRLECSEAINYTDDEDRIITESVSNPNDNPTTLNRVPFFKKGYLKETCSLCSNINNSKTVKKSAGQIKQNGTKITIENNSFITTINVSTTEVTPKILEKKSTFVQTEIEEIAKMRNAEVQFDVENKCKEELDKFVIYSQDLFTDKNSEENSLMKNPNDMKEKTNLKSTNEAKQIIADSDSDDANESSVMQVTAEVHRSSDEV